MFRFPFKKLFIIILIISGIPISSYLVWLFHPEREFDILIMNKTASSLSRMENKPQFWILTYNKYFKRTGERYDRKNDYYGFIPGNSDTGKDYNIRAIRLIDIDSLALKYDMAWFIDSYGLSLGDWYGDPAGDIYSELFYGGLNQNDYLFLKEMIDRNKLVIAEFNFFASPTSHLVRSKTEEMFDIYWSGWTGIYFETLDYRNNPDLPHWIVASYIKQSQSDWTYSNPGIILVNQDNTIVVLEYEKHIDIEMPVILTNETYASKYGVSQEVFYPNRFDITFPADTSAVVSYFELTVNARGKELLEKHNLPFRFPAVISGNKSRRYYYLSGNFSNFDIPTRTSMMKGTVSLDYLFYNENAESISKVFWTFYYPMISTILDEYYSDVLRN